MDNFREWLSDNLRYFMLGGAILLIVAVLFFGVRACVEIKKGNSEQQGTEQQSAENNNQGNVPSSPEDDGETNDGKKEEDTNPMEKNNAEISALAKSYYKALGEKDIATLRTLVNDLSPSDEAKITNAKDYIEGYEVGDVYSKKGLTADSYVVYVAFSYICKGIDTPAPALSQLYMVKDTSGSLKIEGNAEQDTKISAYTEELLNSQDVAELISDVQAQNDAAQQNDPALAEFLEGLGKEVSTAVPIKNGTMLTVKESCNVRSTADEEGEVLKVLEAGTQVEKIGQENEWIEVKYDDGTGYIHSSLLE